MTDPQPDLFETGAVLDTEGWPLPPGVNPFAVHGLIDGARFAEFCALLGRQQIDLNFIDAGDHSAGSIRILGAAKSDEEKTSYRVNLNRNHAVAIPFATLLHELGHLFLGHLGPDKHLNIPVREALTHAQQELEAESVAYMACHRNGVRPNSESYLSNFVSANPTIDNLDLYRIMGAAGRVETLLGLSHYSKFSTRNRR